MLKHEASVEKAQKLQGAVFLLVTNRSGGLGRSFASADGVMHLTPCYNPALCQQCMDRVVSLPSQQLVRIYHLLASDSIETRLMNLRSLKSGKAMSLLDPNRVNKTKVAEVKTWNRKKSDEFMRMSYAIARSDADHEERRLRTKMQDSNKDE
ncbi:hypothetical protein FB567DRAFT_617130 [Paraphoma chrysanthemicola]|uniref:Uncharacterized protein n=1 Tax=Paraphoma chrysanthemicola TaxID=798071 RepID=A0A8K0RFA6_9PLEO|nr:hypothetical protein FB567DRAFT_617130 [Paraphoma chrysanthemicola]